MKAPKWLKQRSTWMGIAAIAAGIGSIIAGETVIGIEAIWGGLTTIFLREAIANVNAN